MPRESLDGYSSDELLLRVANEEPLYLIRHDDGLREVLDGLFHYTDEQWERLVEALEDEEE